jgi:anti-sigma-K factor RskA
MDYGRPDRAERLACEHALGTLRGPARRRFDALLPAHPQLRDALARWQSALMPLASSIAAVQPPARVWTRIESRLFPSTTSTTQWWQRLIVWRTFGGLSAAAAVVMLALWLAQAPPITQPPVVVVLGVNPQVAQAVQARFVASVSPDGRALVLRPIDAPPLTAQQVLELWAVPASGAPRSLGLVRADTATTVLRARLLDNTAAFAISIEPAGGSPSGQPTGPIVSLGKLAI